LKKYLGILICIGIITATLCGCGKKTEDGPSESAVLDAKLFGTWNQISTDGSTTLEDIGIPAGYTFNEDGTGTDLFWDMDFSYQTGEGILYLDYIDPSCDDSKYDYSIVKKVLTMTRVADDAITMTYAQDVPEEETTQPPTQETTQAPTEAPTEAPEEYYEEEYYEEYYEEW